MINKDLKKDILTIIIFTVLLVFGFVYIKPIWSFLGKIFKLFMPFIIGLVLAFVLNILVNFLEKKFFSKSKISIKSKRNICLVIALTIVISFLTFMLLLIVPQVKNTTEIFVENIPKYQENVVDLLNKIGVDGEIRANIITKSKDLSTKIANYFKDNSGALIKNILGIASNVVTSIVNIFIGVIFAIYLLIEKERLLSQSKKIMQAYLPLKRVNKISDIAKLSNKTFASFVSGQFLEAFIIGTLCLIGMLILRIPYAATISVLVGFTALIPVFGAFIGTIIGAFLIFMVSPIKALIFIIFILVLQQIEGNLIYPKVMGKRVNLPSIWVLVAVTIGGSISGVIGMMLSVPIVSIIYSTVATDVNYRLNKNFQAQKLVKTKIKS